MIQWYFYSIVQFDCVGLFDDEVVCQYVCSNLCVLVWCEGMSGWMVIGEVFELLVSMVVLIGVLLLLLGVGGCSQCVDDIEFCIVGYEMQFVEIELDLGESVIVEVGVLMFKDVLVQMDIVFGDGLYSGQGGGLMDKLMLVGKCVLIGESLFVMFYMYIGQGKVKVVFVVFYFGIVLFMKLDQYGGCLVCQKDSFLVGVCGVQIGVQFQCKIMIGLFGGEGFIMQKFEGDGWVFIYVGGCVVECELVVGECLDVDIGCVVVYYVSVDMDVCCVVGIKSMVFGGEGVFLVMLIGFGKVWLQLLLFLCLVGWMWMVVLQVGGQSCGEGLVLGGIGCIFDGDNCF